MRRLAIALLPVLLHAACSSPSWEEDAEAAIAAAQRGEGATAERLIQSALERGAGTGMPDANRGELLVWLGWLRANHADPSEAIAPLEEAIAVLREVSTARNPLLRQAVRRLAQVRSNLGDLEAAEQGFRENWQMVGATTTRDSTERLGSINDLAHILAKRGKYDEAEELVAQGFALLDRYRSKDEGNRGTLILMSAYLKRQRAEHAAAERLYREAIARFEGQTGMAVYLADAQAGLAGTLAATGRREEAEAAYRSALAALEGAPERAAPLRTRIETEYREFAAAR